MRCCARWLRWSTWAVLLSAPLWSAPPSAHAAPILFTGIDVSSGVGEPHPLSDAAAAAFDAAAGVLGPVTLVDFEALAPGNFVSTPIGGGITATQAGNDAALGGIVADGYADDPNPIPAGHDTTSGGSQFIGFVPQFNIGIVGPATLDFSFLTPVQAFGVYLTDLEDDLPGDLVITFDDGSVQEFPIAKAPAGFSTQFWGFTDSGASITNVTLRLDDVVSGEGLREIYGVDDLRIVPVPEPASITLILAGLIAMSRRRRHGRVGGEART